MIYLLEIREFSIMKPTQFKTRQISSKAQILNLGYRIQEMGNRIYLQREMGIGCFEVIISMASRIRGSRGRLVGNAVVFLLFTLNSCWNVKPGESATAKRGRINWQILVVVLVVVVV